MREITKIKKKAAEPAAEPELLKIPEGPLTGSGMKDLETMKVKTPTRAGELLEKFQAEQTDENLNLLFNRIFYESKGGALDRFFIDYKALDLWDEFEIYHEFVLSGEAPKWWKLNLDSKGREKSREFFPPQMAKYLMKRYHFNFDLGQLHIYDPPVGRYVPEGRDQIFQKMQALMGNSYRDHRAEEVYRYIKVKPGQNFNQDPHTLNLKNGLYKIKEKELVPHSPLDLSTIQLGVDFKPGATCPQFNKFLKSTFADLTPSELKKTIDLIYEMFAFALLHHYRYERFFVLQGAGENGKSTMLLTLKNFLGPLNCSEEELGAITNHRYAGSSLAGKLANINPDLEILSLKCSGILKQITSGEEVTIEQKFIPRFKLKRPPKLLFGCNDIPRASDNSPAFYRRFLIIPFNQRFRVGGKNTIDNLKETLTRTELPGIFLKVMQAYDRLSENKGFTKTAASEKALEKYQMDNENCRQFIDDACEVGPELPNQSKNDLYKIYVKWCHDSGYKSLGKSRFIDKILQLVPTITESRTRPAGGVNPQKCLIGIWARNEE